MMCSSTRFVYKIPNTLLGFIPLGSNENVFPVKNIAAVSTASKFLPGRGLFGLIFAIGGLFAFTANVLIGLILLLIGLLMLLTCFPSVLVVTNPAGGQTAIVVSSLEAAKLKKFAGELQNRVFADQAQIHHDEAQSMRMMQAQLQQMQLQQMQQQNQQQMPPMPQQNQFPPQTPQQ